ncbi:MAG: TonB-dependent receptor [Bacteroidota bacterium]
MKKRYYFSILFALLTNFALAQSVSLTFRVLDAQNDAPIPFALVAIQPCNCGGTTDDNGSLVQTLDRGTDYTVITSFLSYQSDTLTITVGEKQSYTIRLEAQDYLLEQVTLTSTNANQNIESTQIGVQQLNATQIKTLPTAVGEVDVFRSISMLSGVGSAGEASNGLSVRGSSLDQNLILLENAPIFNPTHLFGVFSVFTPDAVSAVELYKANMPARYGGRIASVMEVGIKNPDMAQFNLRGGVGLVSNHLAAEIPIIKDKLSVLVSGRASQDDFLFRFIERLKNTEAAFQDAVLKLVWRASEKDNISWTSFFSNDFYQLDINSSLNNIAATSNQYKYLTWNNTLNWLHTFDNKMSLRLNYVYSDYRPQILFPQTAEENTITYQSSILYQSVFSELNWNPNPTTNLTFGLQGLQNRLSPGQLLPGRSEVLDAVALEEEQGLELSAYTSLNWNPSERLAVSAGLRFTQFYLLGPYTEAIYASASLENPIDDLEYAKGEIVQGYNGLEPRLGIRYKLSDRTSLKASYTRSKQYLQNIYNSTTPLPTSRWKMSDRYLLPQAGNTYSLGLYQNLKNQTTLSLEGYYRSIANVIDYKAGAEFFLQEFIEHDVVQGEGINYGIEFNYNRSKGKWNGWFNYTWSRSLRRFNAIDLKSQINGNRIFPSDFDRPHVFNGTINFEANDFNTFSFNFTYQTGRPYTTANAIFAVDDVFLPIFLERNNSRLPDYHRLDFSWRIHNPSTDKTKRWKSDWVFTLYNLYGRQNAYNIYYGSRSGTDLGAIFGSSPLGSYQLSIFSSVVVSLGYNFVFR